MEYHTFENEGYYQNSEKHDM